MSSNLSKLKQAFVQALGIAENTDFNLLAYGKNEFWDSVAHMQLIATIEESFDIMMETEDVIDLSSFNVAKDLLKKNYEVDIDA